MHTFFINTSKACASDLYRELLFEKLIAEKKLIIPRDYYPLEELGACASQAAQLIDQEADISEDVRFVLYVENRQTHDDETVCGNARMIAEEELLTIKIENVFVQQLFQHGKIPAEMLVIFGEREKRSTVGEDDCAYQETREKTLWRNIALPPCKDVAAFIREQGKKLDETQLEAYLCSAAGEGKLISQQDACYKPLVKMLAKHLLYRSKKYVDDFTDALVLKDLCIAIDEYKESLAKDAEYTKRKTKLVYAYQLLEERDQKERNRNVCRLMLGVYMLAAQSCALDDALHAINRQAGESGGFACTGEKPHDAIAVPEVNYEKLAECLHGKLALCENVVYTEMQAPAELNEKLKQGRADDGGMLIASAYEMPDLNAEMNAKRGITVRALRRAVDETLDALDKKNSECYDQTCYFLNNITSEYDRIKDDALRRVPVTQELRQAAERSVGDLRTESAHRNIDNLKNFGIQLKRIQTQAELSVLDFTGRITPTKDISEGIRNARNQANVYFDCLKHDLFLLLCCIFFLLVFMVPYFTVRFDLFNDAGGYIFFVLTAVAVCAAIGCGYFFFVGKYKRKIIKMMDHLCDEFTQVQAQNKACLERYLGLLYSIIPRCYGLSQYEEVLRSYSEDVQLRQRKMTYHQSALRQRIAGINALLDNLDCARPDKQEHKEEFVELDPQKSRIENEAFYILSQADVLAMLENGEERTV